VVSIISGTGAAICAAVVIDYSTCISYESVYKISSSWVYMPIFYVLSFGAVYLALWDFAMDVTKERHQILCKSQKQVQQTPWQ
jgi:phosphate/sulfate permease